MHFIVHVHGIYIVKKRVAENKLLILHEDELYKLLIHKFFYNPKLNEIEHFLLDNKDDCC